MSLTETSGPAADVVSFGCRLNAHESEIVAQRAAEAGVDDVVVVNTCAVTKEAVAQARCMETNDFARAYRAFAAKQTPAFEGD